MPCDWAPSPRSHDTLAGPISPALPAHSVSSRSVIRPFFGTGRARAPASEKATAEACGSVYGKPHASLAAASLRAGAGRDAVELLAAAHDDPLVLGEPGEKRGHGAAQRQLLGARLRRGRREQRRDRQRRRAAGDRCPRGRACERAFETLQTGCCVHGDVGDVLGAPAADRRSDRRGSTSAHSITTAVASAPEAAARSTFPERSSKAPLSSSMREAGSSPRTARRRGT